MCIDLSRLSCVYMSRVTMSNTTLSTCRFSSFTRYVSRFPLTSILHVTSLATLCYQVYELVFEYFSYLPRNPWDMWLMPEQTEVDFLTHHIFCICVCAYVTFSLCMIVVSLSLPVSVSVSLSHSISLSFFLMSLTCLRPSSNVP